MATESVDSFLKAFVSLFVAIDLLGALPLFFSMTIDLPRSARNPLISKSLLTALVVGVVFALAGSSIFNFLGITENDFRVAGGLLLLIFATRDLLSDAGHHSPSPTAPGIVPIGVPLVMGPAALASILLSAKEFGWAVTLAALVLNLALVFIGFRNAHLLMRVFGRELSQAVGKICSLLLAAIAIMLIRLGILGMMSP